MANNEVFLVNHTLKAAILFAKYFPELWGGNPNAMPLFHAVSVEDWNGRWREFNANIGPEEWVMDYDFPRAKTDYYVFGSKPIADDVAEFCAIRDREAGYENGYDASFIKEDGGPQKPKFAFINVDCASEENRNAVISAVVGDKGLQVAAGTAIGADGAQYAYALDSNPTGFGVSGIWCGPPDTVPIPWRSAA